MTVHQRDCPALFLAVPLNMRGALDVQDTKDCQRNLFRIGTGNRTKRVNV